jgi:hypothetical protein
MKYKTEGQKLFDSYDRATASIVINGRLQRISDDFPRRSWHQLHEKERERWERIANGEFFSLNTI